MSGAARLVDTATAVSPPAGSVRGLREVCCAFCQGAGDVVQPTGARAPCPACSRRGRVRLREPVVPCVYCLGKGVHPPLSRQACPVCGGVGVLEARVRHTPCADCRGTGRVVEDEPELRFTETRCARCRGTGLEDRRESDPP